MRGLQQNPPPHVAFGDVFKSLHINGYVSVEEFYRDDTTMSAIPILPQTPLELAVLELVRTNDTTSLARCLAENYSTKQRNKLLKRLLSQT